MLHPFLSFAPFICTSLCVWESDSQSEGEWSPVSIHVSHLPQQVGVLLVPVHHVPGVELLYEPLDPGHQVRQGGGQQGLWTEGS